MPIEKIFTKQRILELREKGLINQKAFPNQEVLDEIIADAGKLKYKVTSRMASGIDIDHPPEITKGLTICYKCRMIYWITPRTDFHTIPRIAKKTGREEPYCYPCAYSLTVKNMRSKEIEEKTNRLMDHCRKEDEKRER